MWPFKKPPPDAFNVETLLELVDAGIIKVTEKNAWIDFTSVPGLPNGLTVFKNVDSVKVYGGPTPGGQVLHFSKASLQALRGCVQRKEKTNTQGLTAGVDFAMSSALEAFYFRRLAELERKVS